MSCYNVLRDSVTQHRQVRDLGGMILTRPDITLPSGWWTGGLINESMQVSVLFGILGTPPPCPNRDGHKFVTKPSSWRPVPAPQDSGHTEDPRELAAPIEGATMVPTPRDFGSLVGLCPGEVGWCKIVEKG